MNRIGAAFAQANRTNEVISPVTDESAESYLGCSFNEYKRYIEEQFHQSGSSGIQLTWDNMADWDLDHRVPLCQFPLERELGRKEAFHSSNTQPLHRTQHAPKIGYRQTPPSAKNR